MLEIVSNPIWNKIFNEMAHPDVSELVANGPNQIFVTKRGVREEIVFPNFSERVYLDSIQDGLVPYVKTERAYEDCKYLFEGRLKINTGGAEFEGRCHIELPPVVDYPQITIAKKTQSLLSIDQIAAAGSMSTEMLTFLKSAVKSNLTIAISGKTGAGKTTMLESLTKLWDDNERIGVAEDVPELVLSQPNVTYSRSEPWSPDRNKDNIADLTFLIRQWQRKRLTKGIIGETRGPEFSEFLVAANSGLEGSMTTIHANDPVMCLDKMTRFALKGSDNQPIRSINMEIGSTIDLIIQLQNINGKHRVSHIAEVTNTVSDADNAKLTSQNIYIFDSRTEVFIKENSITDSLRERFVAADVQLSTLLSTEVGSTARPHTMNARNINSEALNRSKPQNHHGGGLPSFGREI